MLEIISAQLKESGILDWKRRDKRKEPIAEPPAPKPQYLNPVQMATQLGVSVAELPGLAQQGKIKQIRGLQGPLYMIAPEQQPMRDLEPHEIAWKGIEAPF